MGVLVALILTGCNKDDDALQLGWISVSSSPYGANVYLDDSLTGKQTNCLLEDISPGDYTLKISLPGYFEYSEPVKVVAGDTAEVSAVLNSDLILLKVKSDPSGADIWLDGANTGYQTEYNFRSLAEGQYDVGLTLAGYLDWDTTVSLNKGDTVVVHANLTGNHGTIKVISDPAGADVYLDDSLVARKTNCYLEMVAPGSRTVRLFRVNHFAYETSVNVTAGDTAEINVMLESILRWRYQTPDMIVTSPAIATDGAIYFASLDGTLYALDATGSLKWSYSTGESIESSPAIDPDGTVYFGSHDNYVYAIDPSGNFKWRYGSSANVTSSPAIGADGTIYVGVSARRTVTQEMVDYLYALNPDSILQWSYEIGENDTRVTSSPAIGADGTVYFACEDKHFYAINPDGFLKWRYDIGAISVSSPAIGSDGTIYFGCSDHNLYALSPQGDLCWRFAASGGIDGSAAIGSDGTIYFGSDGARLYALDQNGNKLWEYNTGKPIKSSPAVGADGIIYIGALFSGVYALNRSGVLLWVYETGASVKSSPAIGSNGAIYVGCDDGYFYALKSESYGLASSSWSRFGHDNRNTSRVGGP